MFDKELHMDDFPNAMGDQGKPAPSPTLAPLHHFLPSHTWKGALDSVPRGFRGFPAHPGPGATTG